MKSQATSNLQNQKAIGGLLGHRDGSSRRDSDGKLTMDYGDKNKGDWIYIYTHTHTYKKEWEGRQVRRWKWKLRSLKVSMLECLRMSERFQNVSISECSMPLPNRARAWGLFWVCCWRVSGMGQVTWAYFLWFPCWHSLGSLIWMVLCSGTNLDHYSLSPTIGWR